MKIRIRLAWHICGLTVFFSLAACAPSATDKPGATPAPRSDSDPQRSTRGRRSTRRDKGVGDRHQQLETIAGGKVFGNASIESIEGCIL